jgi:glycosyltransferase involved in cell wall biosynthesis
MTRLPDESGPAASDGGATLGVSGWRLHGPRTGIGRYLSNVMRFWTREAAAGRFDAITLYTPAPVERDEIVLPDAVHERVLGPHWRMLVWENLRLGPTVSDDVLFCPSYSRPLATRSRTVVTCFEATQKLHPEFYPAFARLVYSPLFGWSSRHATLVITATEAARKDIVGAYGVPEERVRVVPLAPAEAFRPRSGDPRLEEVRHKYVDSTAPYVLYVGKLTARRNVPMLVEAFAELKRRSTGPHVLLVIGLNTTGLDVIGMARTLGVENDVRYVEYVPDDDLALLYSGADMFVLPYAYEALSLTALEAQASGCPVITVDAPGLREQTGGRALLVPRADVRELVEAMSRLAGDAQLRARLVEDGLAHAGRFSWERCSLETLAVLDEAASMPG